MNYDDPEAKCEDIITCRSLVVRRCHSSPNDITWFVKVYPFYAEHMLLLYRQCFIYFIFLG